MRPPYSVLARRMGPGGAGALRGGARRNYPSLPKQLNSPGGTRIGSPSA